jgi:hypothetical protein
MSRPPISVASLAALSLLAAGCAKPVQTTTTTRTAVAPPPPAVGPPHAPGAPAFATGPGVVGDTSQTAALSAPANSNGTIPSKGVIPPPSR